MKKQIYKCACAACALSILLSCITFDCAAISDEPVGKMSSVYGYILNDYLLQYGAVMTDSSGGTLYGENGEQCAPTGVVYGDIVNFDANENPYLVIYVTDGEKHTAECHIWKYNEELKEAQKTAALARPYDGIGQDCIGEFDLGWNDEKRYIIYKEFTDGELSNEEYYTVIDGDALMYVNDPENVSQTDIMDFNAYYFHPGVDVCECNKSLSDFFDKLKNAAADSVTYTDIAERLRSEDETRVEAVLSKAVMFDSFDIADYSTLDEYKEALDAQPISANRFYLISNMYNLGDEIYYVRFSTDKTYYNYALLRRSDTAENGYQILKIKTDCIPLADIELRELKEEYSRSTMLYKKSKGSLKLSRKVKEESGSESEKAEKAEKKPLFTVEKFIDNRMRLPIACIGAGVAIALLTVLWVFLYGSDD